MKLNSCPCSKASFCECFLMLDDVRAEKYERHLRKIESVQRHISQMGSGCSLIKCESVGLV